MRKELDNFLKMIASFALGSRIIFALTHCEDDKKRGSKQWFDSLINEHKRLEFINNSNGEPFEIDSVSGRNIEMFKSIMISEALKYEKTRVTIPPTFFNFKDSLDKLVEFSISQVKFNELGKAYIKDDMIVMARDIFKSWGIIYVLSNGDIVLKPQKLADVLACLFTKSSDSNERIQSYLWGGYFKHNKKVLKSIWGKSSSSSFPKELWLPTKTSKSIPFIDLLHESGLAYPMFDVEGKPLRKSVIPSMLSVAPLNLSTFESMKDEDMIESIFGKKKFATIHTSIALTFHPNLPKTFVGQLQARVSSVTVTGGAWKYGCSTQSKDNKSCAIFYVNENLYESDNLFVIYLVSGGIDKNQTSARDSVLIAIHDLIRDKYDSLVCSIDKKKGSVQLVRRISDSSIDTATSKFRFTTYLTDKKESKKVQISNIIDKSTRKIDLDFTSNLDRALARSESFSSTSLQELQFHMDDSSMTSITNYLWNAMPDLLEITIGQPTYSDIIDRILGVWLVFKDPKKSNQFHAIHFYFNDSDGNWHYDRNYGKDSSNNQLMTIAFESSSGEVSLHKNSRDLIEMMKSIFEKRVSLPPLLDSSKPWSLLVCMSLDKKTKVKLVNHEEEYYKERPKVNDKVCRYHHISTLIFKI
jgi:hypothetical protein